MRLLSVGVLCFGIFSFRLPVACFFFLDVQLAGCAIGNDSNNGASSKLHIQKKKHATGRRNEKMLKQGTPTERRRIRTS